MQGNVTLYVSELFMKLLLFSAATDGPVSRKFWGSKAAVFTVSTTDGAVVLYFFLPQKI